MWNPEADVDALFNEWLQRAYGKEAAVPMEQLYDLLETEVGNYKRTHRVGDWTLAADLVRLVYPKIFPEMERLYSAAMALAKTEPQRARLAMFGDNLVLLHWNLRKAGLLKDPEKSVFYRSDDDFLKFAEKTCNTLAVSPTKAPKDGNAVEEFMRQRLFPAEQKKAKIPKRPPDVPAPVIDGDLSDALWKNAVMLEGFALPGDYRPGGQRTEAKAAFDAENLYVSFLCREDKMQNLRAGSTKRDDLAIYEDDCIEVFLGQAGDKAVNNYWHITVNANNAVWDNFKQALTNNLALKSAVKKTVQAWVVELAIPLKDLTFGDPSGKTWKVNLCREEKPHSENSSWNPVEQGFCAPENFGVWEFAK